MMSRISCSRRAGVNPAAIWHSIKGMLLLLLGFRAMKLFKAADQFFVVGCAFHVFGKMLAMLDEIDPPALAKHNEDIVLRFACRLAHHTQQTRCKLTLLFVGSTVSHIT
ncbi:hypothetical protein PCAR4_1180030 [Paraburkholderia caribensis]|nr:hypothetical protein PCAR4_1180030 [Paraburkholderia caribensis]